LKITKIPVRKCPICEHGVAYALHHQKFVLPEGYPLSEGYKVLSCLSCGFVYADIVPDQQGFDTYYTAFSKYEDKKTTTGGGETSWDMRRLKFTAKYLKDVWPDKTKHIEDSG